MYKYKVIKEEEKAINKWQEDRISIFSLLEDKLENIKKLLRQGKIETIKYYRENPESYTVVRGTDLVGDYINDIEILLKQEE